MLVESTVFKDFLGDLFMIINDKLIDKIAKLAKLDVSDLDKKKMAQQLSKILNHMKLMDEISVDGINPMFHGCIEEYKLREDEVVDFEDKSLLLNPNYKQDNYFTVPNVIAEEEY